MDLGSSMENEARWPLLHEGGSSDLAKPKLKAFDWRAPAIVLAVEFLESIAYAGIALNLIVYLGTVLHGTPASNAANVDTWNGTTFLTPLLGAFLADAYLGKYKTIAISFFFYLAGMLVLTASAAIPSLRPAPCDGNSCPPATGFQYFISFLALYLVSIGTGGVKSSLLPFGGDQYDEGNPEEAQKKQSFFSLFFVAVNLGVFIAGTVVVYIQQSITWAVGFGISLLCLVIAAVFFFSGTQIFRVQVPTGSPLKSVADVLIASLKNRKLAVPADSTLLYEKKDEDWYSGDLARHKLAHTDGCRFLDKAAIVVAEAGRDIAPCTVTQVEEVKIIFRMLPVWATCVFYAAAMSQTLSTFILQGNAMDTKIGSFNVPAASLNSASVVFMMGWVVVHDKVVIPAARYHFRNSAGLTQLQRMGAGRFLVIFAMAAAALVETWRLKSVRAGRNISIGWQVPQYLILSASDVFAGIAQLEFFYSEAPEMLRSMCSAFSFLAASLAYYVNTFVVTTVAAATSGGGSPGWIPANLNEGHLDYYFWLWAAISVVNFVAYAAIARRYTVKKLAPQ